MPFLEDNRERWARIERLGWIRTGALGDCLVGLAALAEVPTLFPRARVTVMGPRLWTEILSPAQYPFIEAIAAIDKKSGTVRLHFPNGERWSEDPRGPLALQEAFKDLDGVVNFNIDSYRYGFAALRARVPVRIGSAPSSMAWLYTHASPWFGKDPLIHERDAALLVLEYATSGMLRFLRQSHSNRANLDDWLGRSRLVAKWRERGLPPGKSVSLPRARELTGREPHSYVLLNPTSSRREKAWPSRHFIALLERTSDEWRRMGLEAIVIGAPNETEWLREIAGNKYRIVQPKDLFDLQDVVAGARALLANTSSVQFIAAMTQTPVLTLMGRGQPVIWGPLGPRDQIIRGQPPEELRDRIFEQELAAYESIDVDVVARALLALTT